MEALKAAYIDFINYWDPYNQDETPATPEEMLYNLVEIRNDLEECNQPENDCSQSIWRVNDAIKKFKAAGIKASNQKYQIVTIYGRNHKPYYILHEVISDNLTRPIYPVVRYRTKEEAEKAIQDK